MQNWINKIHCGEALEILRQIPSESVNCCITSPPYYGLRDYGCKGQIGLEETPEKYVERLADIFDEVKRILKKDGTLWLVIGDSYNGSGKASGCDNLSEKQNTNIHSKHVGSTKIKGLKPKDLIGIPWMVAFELRRRGWWLRQDIIWHKPSCMPESVTDRCTKAHEYVFLLSKLAKYYFDYEAIQEEATEYDGRKDTLMKGSEKYKTGVVPGQAEHTIASRGHERWKKRKNKGTGYAGDTKRINNHSGYSACENPYVRNKRSVWIVNPQPFKEAHFAVFPPKLIKDMILSGSRENGIILDPFMGAGTAAVVSRKLNRNFIGIELNEKYVQLANKRIDNELGMFK